MDSILLSEPEWYGTRRAAELESPDADIRPTANGHADERGSCLWGGERHPT